MLTITTEHKLSKADIVRIFADLVLMRKIVPEKIQKNNLLRLIKNHLKYQGITTQENWYEITECKEQLDEIKARVTPIVDQMFKD